MSELWNGIIIGVCAVISVQQVMQRYLEAVLERNKWKWRTGRFFSLKIAKIVQCGNTAMYACGGQIISEPYIRGWRIVVPVTFDPKRILGDLSDAYWHVHDPPDAVVPVTDISMCTALDYDALSCDLETRVVYVHTYESNDTGDVDSDEYRVKHKTPKDS